MKWGSIQLKSETVMTKAILHSLFTFFIFCSLAEAKEEFREFTSASGQTMTARPVAVIGSQVRIEREDGSEFNVDTSIFAKEDAEYLKMWMLKFLAEQGRLLKINAKGSSDNSEKSQTESTKIKTWEGFYLIKVENVSDVDIDDLRIEYEFFVYDDKAAADKRNSGDVDPKSGKLEAKRLSARKTVDFQSDRVKMMETELKSGWYYVGGGDEESKDRLEGIRMKIYSGKEFLMRYADTEILWSKYK